MTVVFKTRVYQEIRGFYKFLIVPLTQQEEIVSFSTQSFTVIHK